MKYAITGHTHGLGEYFYKNTENCLGFSRSNGYNISKSECRKQMIDLVQDCDVFINNAYCGSSQTDLLYELYEVWKDRNKIIINIGSNTTDGIKNFIHPYAAWKNSLEKASEQLSYLNNPCKVTLLKFGWIGTDRIIINIKPKKYILLKDAYEFIINNIEWNKKYNLNFATLLP